MIHRIKWGDTLSQLAQKYGTSVNDLAKANNIANPDLIYAGRSLKIPGKTGTPGAAPVSSPSRPGGAKQNTATNGVDSVTAPASGKVKGGISSGQLRQIMPTLSSSRAEQLLPHLNKAMSEAGITTKGRQTAFLAQLAHESAGLRYFEEIASGAAYEGRRDLGNTQPGDGVRFKGRGPIQLTGRANYTAASRALGIDLVNNPKRAADPDVGFRIATWFWQTRGLNSLADQGNFREITRRINGGYNGYTDRLNYYRRAQSAL